MQSVAGIFTTVVEQPTISIAAYSSGDQLGGLQTLSQAALGDGLYCTLKDLVVVDLAKQKSALEVLFFNKSPTLISGDNEPLNISDADVAEYFVGNVSVAAADYKDLSASSVATVVADLSMNALGGQGTLYAVAMSAGTPTYTSSGSLYFKFTFSKQY